MLQLINANAKPLNNSVMDRVLRMVERKFNFG
jgi:hypothetical protein